MTSRAARYQAQATTAAIAASRVNATAQAAAVEESLSDVTGGGSDTIAELRTEVDALKLRVDDLEP